MIESQVLLTAFVLGVMGAGHCLGMCGGLAAALAFANNGRSRAHRIAILLGYNFGRVCSYALIGALFGFVFGNFQQLSPVPILRTLSGVLLIAMGLYLADWWRGLVKLEKLGSVVWKPLAPLAKKLMPVTHIQQSLILGLIWGWLPCGLVYSALVLAAAQGTALAGGVTMLAFGFGTIPAVFAGGLASQTLKNVVTNGYVRQVFGTGFIVYGLHTLWPVLTMGLVAMGLLEPSMHSAMDHAHH